MFKMAYFTLGLFLVVSCVCSGVRAEDEYPPPEIFEIIDPLHEICTKRMGVTEDEVKNYKIGDNSAKMMCYMECLMKESKWMSGEGAIQYEKIKELAHPKIKEILLKALAECMDIDAGTKDCELSYNFNVCLQKADPVHWFLP